MGQVLCAGVRGEGQSQLLQASLTGSCASAPEHHNRVSASCSAISQENSAFPLPSNSHHNLQKSLDHAHASRSSASQSHLSYIHNQSLLLGTSNSSSFPFPRRNKKEESWDRDHGHLKTRGQAEGMRKCVPSHRAEEVMYQDPPRMWLGQLSVSLLL